MAGNHPCQFSVVRYGNVSGSTGSIIPYFRKLIKDNNKYLTITHNEMTRFLDFIRGKCILLLIR